jgi:hypothetical protein
VSYYSAENRPFSYQRVKKYFVFEEEMEEFEGLPGIDEYFSAKGSGYPINVEELSHISDALVSYCGFSPEQAKRILTIFFQEIRSYMLIGKIINIRTLGAFVISSPRTLSKTNITIKFFPKRTLVRRINGK